MLACTCMRGVGLCQTRCAEPAEPAAPTRLADPAMLSLLSLLRLLRCRSLSCKDCPKMIMPSAGVHITLPDYYSPENGGRGSTREGRAGRSFGTSVG